MNREEVQHLEEIVEKAISRALRNQRHVPSRIHHLMAKAAVSVLEATNDDDKNRKPKLRKEEWVIDDGVVGRVKEFFDQHQANRFVEERIARNVSRFKSPVSLENFWDCMVVCLLTTQQKSGPKSQVSRLAHAKPFPLGFKVCAEQDDLADFVKAKLTAHGGIRRTTIIGREMAANMAFLQTGGWERTSAVLEEVRANAIPEVERRAAHFIDENFRGFGPKQSRNLLQGIGLTQHETPIDSRITKWLVEFGFPVTEDASALTNRKYYEFVLDQFQKLCAACNILPCVLDAAIFSSFDSEAWDDENVPYWIR
jgi:hypothetical protein